MREAKVIFSPCRCLTFLAYAICSKVKRLFNLHYNLEMSCSSQGFANLIGNIDIFPN